MALALPILAIAATAAGTAYSVYSSVQQANASKEMADYNKKVAEGNAKMAEQQGQYEADRIATRNRILRGEQVANVAANGVTISGSATDVMYSSEIQGELDRLAAIYSGQSSAYRARVQGDIAYQEGKYASDAATARAIGTGFSGVGSAFSQYSSTDWSGGKSKPTDNWPSFYNP